MIAQRRDSGFSAVELLITIFIGAVFIFTGYQLYATITQGNQEVSDLNIASNAARSMVQKIVHNKSEYTFTCSEEVTEQVQFDKYTTEGTLTITCPNSTELPNLRRASVTATYKGTSASHALYYIQ